MDTAMATAPLNSAAEDEIYIEVQESIYKLRESPSTNAALSRTRPGELELGFILFPT